MPDALRAGQVTDTDSRAFLCRYATLISKVCSMQSGESMA